MSDLRHPRTPICGLYEQNVTRPVRRRRLPGQNGRARGRSGVCRDIVEAEGTLIVYTRAVQVLACPAHSDSPGTKRSSRSVSAATNLPQKRSSFVCSPTESCSGPRTDARPGAGARPDSGCDAGGRARAAKRTLARGGTTGRVRLRHRTQCDQQLSAHSEPIAEEDPLDVALEAAATRPDPVEDSERAGLVRQALRLLDSTDRQILLLTLMEGLKPGEIAARLGLTSEVVRTRKSRALKKTVERMKRLSRT